MPTDAFTEHVAALRGLGGHRVWSLMISLFGDLAQDPGQQIEGPVLSAVMHALQVRPEAIRVALHRLRNDGWITSSKRGRISAHALTPKARAESVAASARIYARPDAGEAAWQLIVLPDADQATPAGFIALGARLCVGDAMLPVPERALSFAGREVPDWLPAQVVPVDLNADYAALAHVLSRLSDDIPDASVLNAIQVAVLRCLIVHNWRRLVLKHPAVPSALVARDWPGHLCHHQVTALLDRFERPSLQALDLAHAA